MLDNGVYGQLGSILMAYDVQQTLGYHGNEVRFYDELMGGKNVWQYVTSPNVLELTATRFLVLPQQAELPGWRQVAATMEASTGAAAVLYERDTAPAYARVVPEAARLPEAQIVPTLADPRFPVDRVLLYPDTASVPVRPLGDSLPEPSAVRATVSDWAPGRVRVALDGRADRPAYLMVSETWVPGWEATVDGRPADVHRADEAFLSVVLPPGAREVTFLYRQPGYAAGRLVSLLALALTAAIALAPRWLRRRPAGG